MVLTTLCPLQQLLRKQARPIFTGPSVCQRGKILTDLAVREKEEKKYLLL